MESSRPTEERKTKEHITPRNGIRHMENEEQLDGTRKEGPEQSGLENASRQPMLHWGVTCIKPFVLIDSLCSNKD
ncbi:unnamed protein product [Schistosoma margrebowiei]|uniref:Uncharacterized protein n=1 Tax=Schistosoma margrebowiei TaxID=48269 RepID=A0A183N9P2_9TREM|nr:unnamed protein product [Schistosoma margrebowiei]